MEKNKKELTGKTGVDRLIKAAYTAYAAEVMMECSLGDDMAEELDAHLYNLADCIMVYLENNNVRKNVCEKEADYMIEHNRLDEFQVIGDYKKILELEYPDIQSADLLRFDQMTFHSDQDE